MDTNPNPMQPAAPASIPEPAPTPGPAPAPEPQPQPQQPKNKQSGLVIGIIIGFIVVVAIAAPIILLLTSSRTEPSERDKEAEKYVVDNNPGDDPDDNPPTTPENYVAGIWHCAKGSFSANDSKNFYTTIKLNDDMTFVYGPYDDLDNNHFSGTYTFENENKHTSDLSYSYYMVSFSTDEYILKGEKQEDPKNVSKMEMGISESGNNAGRQAITIFTSSYNTYYCYDYSDPKNLHLTYLKL